MPLRGHDEHEGNFFQLIKLRANDNLALQQWMQRKRAYLSHKIQNEILKIMSHQILRAILKDVSTSLWYSIMVDETVDSSLTEQVLYISIFLSTALILFQVTFCIRHVSPSTLEVQEDCLGLYATDKTDSNTITRLVLDSLTRFNLPLNQCRGQCYDDASSMSGRHSGVATQDRAKEPRAMYIHCMAHSLNLAVQDTYRSIQVMSEAFDVVLELSKVYIQI